MEQITRVVERGEAVRVGVDLAKRVIQVHAVDAAGHVLASRAMVRDKFIAWCAQLPAGCVVVMDGENWKRSQYWPEAGGKIRFRYESVFPSRGLNCLKGTGAAADCPEGESQRLGLTPNE